MPLDPEDDAAIRAERFEDAVAKEQPPVEDRDPGLGGGNQATVEKNVIGAGDGCQRGAAARARARDVSSPWALVSDSAYSASGSESATTPPPTPK